MPTETDAQKFKRLATRRVNLALKHIHLISNLSNRSHYAYTPNDVKRIFIALREAVGETEERFENAQTHQRTTFTLE
jgi:hypothetical protein